MAENKIEIFKLDIDIDSVIKASKDLKTETGSLKAQLDQMKGTTQENSREYVEMEARYKAVRKEYNSSQNELGKLIQLQGKEIKTVEQGRAALSVVSKEWAKQADLYGVNSVEADKLAKKKLELTETLKDLESQTGDNRRNVGNYAEGMKEAITQSGLFQKAQAAVNGVTGAAGPIITFVSTGLKEVKDDYKNAMVSTAGFTKAQIASHLATTAMSGALKVLRLALIATGIGAIVVLLGSLVAWFTKTQNGIDFVNKSLAALSAGFDVLIDRASKFGGAIAKMLSGDWRGGLSDMKESFKGIEDEIQREIDLAVRLEEVLQGVEKAEVNLDIRRSAANARLKELNKTIEDVTKTEEERIAAAQEYARIDNELTAEEVSNQEKKVAAMLGYSEVTEEVREQLRQIGQEGVSLDQLGLSESTIEDAKEFRDEISRLYDMQASSAELQVTNQNKLNTIITQQQAKEIAAAKQRQEAAKAATDAAIAESKTKLQLFIEENKGKADSLAESLQLEEQVRDKRLAILNEELAAKKLSQTEYELAVLQEKNGFLERQAQLTQEYAQKEIEAEKQRLAQRQEIEALEKERKATDLENRMAIEAENFEGQLEIEKQRLEMQRQQELAEAEKTGADKALINKKYAQIEKDIEAEKAQYKRDVAAQTFDNLANILGKESAAGKAAAIAQTTIDTYSAATAAYKAMAGIPVVGPALGAIAAAAAVASGLQSVKKITSTKEPNIPKAAKGATLQGPSHAGGGITLYDENGRPIVEAEGGENIYVLNKRASQLGGLDWLNQITGGVPLTQATTYAAAGGMIQNTMTAGPRGSSQTVDYELMAAKIAEANRSLPAPRVAIDEINNGQGQYAEVVNGAIF